MPDFLWTDSEWTWTTLDRAYKEIECIGREYLGLTNLHANQIEIITSEQMVDAYASVGLPIFYHHWSFGKQFTRNWDMYRKGMQGLAYEIVINSNPCISYLMEENTMTMQALVMAHACVSGDTEYLTPTGWRRLDQYDDGPVGQYHEDGRVTFVQPQRYIVRDQADFIHVSSEKISQAITDDHTVVAINGNDNLIKITGAELARRQAEKTRGFNCKFITGFYIDHESALNLSDEEIMLHIAIKADGSIVNPDVDKSHWNAKSHYRVRFHLKKERKLERLRGLLSHMSIPFDERPSYDGRVAIDFNYPELVAKRFTAEWFNASPRQLRLIGEEVCYWDGSLASPNASFSSSWKEDADFVQYVWAATGRHAHIGRDADGTWGVTQSERVGISLSQHGRDGRQAAQPFNRIPSADGKAYCFTVDTGMLIIRHQDKISVTGNCMGHNYFFANNSMFLEWTDASSIVDYLEFARNYIAKIEVKEGRDVVERFLDSCHAMQAYGVNRYRHPRKLSAAKEAKRAEERERHKQERVSDLWDTLIKEAVADPEAQKPFPPQPEENILYFCEKYAPDLPDWKREILRIVRKIAQYFYPQTQCLTGDAYVYTASGMQKISEVATAEGYNENILDILSLGNKHEQTSHTYKRRVNHTIRLKTALGRTLEGTPEHPILVISPHLEFEMKRLGQLNVGDRPVVKVGFDRAFAQHPPRIDFQMRTLSDRVACRLCNKEYGNLSSHVPMHDITLGDYRAQFPDAPLIAESLLYNRAQPIRVPEEMTHGLARLLGYLVAEGTFSETTWSLPNTDRDMIDDALATLNEMGITPPVTLLERENRQPMWRIDICNGQFRDFMAYCGLSNSLNSFTQQVPRIIMQSPKSIVGSFLAALFEGDGYNSEQGDIGLVSASQVLVEQVQLLLGHFGVVSRLRSDGNYYRLIVVSDFRRDFLESVGFLSKRKQEQPAHDATSPSSDIPFLKAFVQKVKETLSQIPSKNIVLRRESMPCTSSDEFSREKVRNQREEFDYIEQVDVEAHRKIQAVIAQENYYDEVVEIEHVHEEKYVYDFTVPSTHLFVSDWFVSHNTKVMNEGFATHTHYKIMKRLHEQGLMTDGSYLEFIQSHTNVVFQPGFDDRRYSGINPYALGFAMMQDIERIVEKPTEEDYKWFPDIAGTGDGMAVIRDAVVDFRDESFIRQFLSPKVIRDFGLFRITDRKAEPEVEVTAIHDDRGYEHVRESLANNYEHHAIVPQIEVLSVDPKARSLSLRHTSYRNRTLDKSTVMMKHMYALWGGTVFLYNEEGRLIA
jgi:spore cortex formation protein SpoVR/YcgB (stage V sporulation)